MTAAPARITITRKDPADVRDRQIVVSLDGQPLATLMYGEEVSREVPPGPHRLRAHNTLFWKTHRSRPGAGRARPLQRGQPRRHGHLLAARPARRRPAVPDLRAGSDREAERDGRMPNQRTQVAIVGAGPAGLMLGHLLHLRGIDSVILENRSRDYVIERVRAGVLEQGTVDLMPATGVGDRLRREGMRHDGIYIAFDGRRHRIDMAGADRRPGDHDLRAERSRQGSDRGAARDGAAAVLRGRRRSCPRGSTDRHAVGVVSAATASAHELSCDFIAGCDGFHGVCRPAIPPSHLQRLRARVSVRLARDPGQRRAVVRRARLQQSSARLRALQHAVAAGDAAVSPVRAGRGRRATGPTTASGRSCRHGCRPTTAGGRTRGRSSRRASPGCAASSPSRCATAGCSSPATPPTSFRPPAPRD